MYYLFAALRSNGTRGGMLDFACQSTDMVQLKEWCTGRHILWAQIVKIAGHGGFRLCEEAQVYSDGYLRWQYIGETVYDVD